MTKNGSFQTSRTVIVRLSDHCQLKCPHCYFGRSQQRQPSDVTVMTKEKLCALLAQMSNAGIREVHFEGEHPCFNLLLHEVRRAGMHATVSAFDGLFNNGSLDRKSDVLRQVNFSVNSWDSVVHDRLRCKQGDYVNMLHNIEWCHDYGIDKFHWIAISKDNSHDILRHIDFCSSIGSCGLAFLYVSPFGSATHSMCVPPSQWVEICKTIDEIRVEYPSLRIHFEPIFVEKADFNPLTMGCKSETRDLFFVTSDGNVYACPLLAATGQTDFALCSVDDEKHLNAQFMLAPKQGSCLQCVSCAAEDTEIYDRSYRSDLPFEVTKVCWMYWNRAKYVGM